MLTKSKSLFAKGLLGFVALAGVMSAVPASAHPYDGRDGGRNGGGWSHDRGWVQRGYGSDYRDGYRGDHAYGHRNRGQAGFERSRYDHWRR